MKKNLCTNIHLALVLVLFPLLLNAESGRGIRRIVKDTAGNQICIYEESHALVIGISEYTEGWPELSGVKNDIKEVNDILKLN